MSRKNTSPDLPGEGLFLTSSPCWQPQYTLPGHGFLSHIRGRFSASSSLAFFSAASLRLQAAGWHVPTMVLSETRGLWLFWVVRGGIRWPLRLQCLNPPRILTLEPERSVAVGGSRSLRSPASNHALKLLVTSLVPRRTLLLSSRSSARWRRSCAPASAAPSPAACSF